MVRKPAKIVWDKQALEYLKAAVQFIREDSPQNAELVKTRIIAAISNIPDNPMRHAADKYRHNNNGSYMAFEVLRFRIAYHVSKDEIRIVRIRHTSQEPKDY